MRRQWTWGFVSVVASLLLVGCGDDKKVEANGNLPASAEAAPAPAPPPPLTLPEGTPVSVRLVTGLSTRYAAPGEPFEATLMQPLEVDGKVIASRGAHVRGVVADANKGGRVKGVAHISVRLTELEVAAGRTVPLQTNIITRWARRTRKRDALWIAGGSGGGAGIGALAGGGMGAAIGAGIGGAASTVGVLVTHGAPAYIPPEAALRFTLREPLRVNL